MFALVFSSSNDFLPKIVRKFCVKFDNEFRLFLEVNVIRNHSVPQVFKFLADGLTKSLFACQRQDIQLLC